MRFFLQKRARIGVSGNQGLETSLPRGCRCTGKRLMWLGPLTHASFVPEFTVSARLDTTQWHPVAPRVTDLDTPDITASRGACRRHRTFPGPARSQVHSLRANRFGAVLYIVPRATLFSWTSCHCCIQSDSSIKSLNMAQCGSDFGSARVLGTVIVLPNSESAL